MEFIFKEAEGRYPVEAEYEDNETNRIVYSFLVSEVRNFGDFIQQGLSDVLSGKSEQFDFSGNVYSVSANNSLAEITDDISEKDLSAATATQELYDTIAYYREVYKKAAEKINN